MTDKHRGGGSELESKAARLFSIQLRQAAQLSELAKNVRCEIRIGEITVRPYEEAEPKP